MFYFLILLICPIFKQFLSETEDLYIFWKPGEYVVNRERLTPSEWKDWGTDNMGNSKC
jgi:hypothetical protein